MNEKLQQLWYALLKNYDVYAIIIIAIVLAVLSILGNVLSATISSGTLATLALIAFSLLKNRLTDEEIQKSLEQIAVNHQTNSVEHFFKDWDEGLFKQRLDTARELSMLAIANHDFISRNEDLLKDFIKRGGNIRYILLNPESKAMSDFSARSGGAEKSLAEVCLKLMSNLAKDSETGTIKIKLIDQLPSAVVTMLDQQSKSGLIFTSLCGFNQFYLSRPSFILFRNRDSKLFEFYETYFENLWNWEGNLTFDLKQNQAD